jgi:hypothetical protein
MKTEKIAFNKGFEPYFGLGRTCYLQTLANKWRDFKVSWNWGIDEDGNPLFTKKRSVMELWSEEYYHPSECRLEKVMHREAIPHEIFIEIDDEQEEAERKRILTQSLCHALGWHYAVYKSRKGYHISVLRTTFYLPNKWYIYLIGSDGQFVSRRVTWSLEWSNHWKQKDFVIEMIGCSSQYKDKLLGL